LINLLCKLLDIAPDPQNYQAVVIKIGFPPKPLKLSEDLLAKKLSDVFSARESALLDLDPDQVKVKLEVKPMECSQSDHDNLMEEKAEMAASNKGCNVGQATKITQETVRADGNCLFNVATLAMEGVIDKPREMREIIASIMLSDPDKWNAASLGK
jgi:hypothetical protein